MHLSRLRGSLFIAPLLLCVAAPAVAQPASSLIRVGTCMPALNLRQSPGYVGYTPGLWGGPYYPDVYGYRFYRPPVTSTSPQLAIDYTNITNKTMRSIEFGLVANGILRAEVRDVGTFSPNAEIKHSFELSPNVFPLRTALAQCVPLRIQYADGTKWKNRALPHKNQQIYYRP